MVPTQTGFKEIIRFKFEFEENHFNRIWNVKVYKVCIRLYLLYDRVGTKIIPTFTPFGKNELIVSPILCSAVHRSNPFFSFPSAERLRGFAQRNSSPARSCHPKSSTVLPFILPVSP